MIQINQSVQFNAFAAEHFDHKADAFMVYLSLNRIKH